MSNEQYLTDLFIYQAESLAASDADMINGDDFEIEYDGGHSGDVSIRGLMAEALKRLRKAETERDELAAHVDRMSRLIFDTYAAIEDGDVHAIPYDEARNLHNASPTTSLARRDDRMKAEALEEAADMAHDEIWQMEYANIGSLRQGLLDKSAEYRKQAEGES